MEKLFVDLGKNSYDILFSDSFSALPKALTDINAPKKLLVVTDSNVEKLYADEVNNLLKENGYDTVEANLHLGFKADERDYGVGANILRQLGVTKMRLLTNNPVKRVGLQSYGLEVVENVPIEVIPNEYNRYYMHTKKVRMGHDLHKVD